MKLSKTIRRHPVWVIRKLLGKTQEQFADWFGKSLSYIQKVEIGKLDLSQNVADAIMIRLGIDSESLKQKYGWPVSLLLDSKKFNFGFGDPKIKEPPKDASDKAILKSKMEALDSGAALCRKLEELSKIKDKGLRLHESMKFWQQYASVSHWKETRQPIDNVLTTKLRLLLDAAGQKGRYHAVAIRLSHWLDETVKEFRLRERINDLRAESGEKWTPFIESLGAAFCPEKRRKR
jgi:transcriptional regulator with XRE-family HTH domain